MSRRRDHPSAHTAAKGESTLGFIRQLYVATVGPLPGWEPPWSRPERTAATPLEPGSSSRQFDLNERIGLIWSDRVNFSGSVDLFLSLLFSFVSRGQIEQQPGQV